MITKSNLSDLLTKENATSYADAFDKLVFCSDITGLRIDDKRLEDFEDALELKATRHGFM
tara:strand:+ start:417 stop:596 length:180 start_codon:yes stop_codon:yes gene_type:complete